MIHDAPALLQNVVAITKRAARIMRQDFVTWQKNDVTNIVTSADIRVQAYLKKHLCCLLSGSALFGEEDPRLIDDAEYLWIVDPIDGTNNFVRGMHDYAISVGLYSRGKMVLGVVYSPRLRKLYTALAGQGAWCNGKAIRVSDVSFPEGMFCTAMSLYRKDLAPLCMDIISDVYSQCNDVRRFGSCALELCYLAEGICDLYFEIRVFPWDYAAALLVLQEAGGFIGGCSAQELTFDRTTPVIAANSKENYEKLQTIVSRHMTEIPYKEVF